MTKDHRYSHIWYEIETRVLTPMLCNMRKERRRNKNTRRDAELLVNLVKRSGVVEAAVPDFIDDSGSVFIVLTAGSVGD